MNCVFCEKSFTVKSNCNRHQLSCKLNPDKLVKEVKPKLLKSKILLEKEELCQKEKLLLQEIEMMKKLLLNKSDCENKIVSDSPFKKDKYLAYINKTYSNAFTIKEALGELSDLLTVEKYKELAFRPFVSKYKSSLELFFKSFPKEQYPFVIVKNVPSKEVGYVNIDGKFYKFYGEQLYTQLTSFITGVGVKDYYDGCKGIQGIFVQKNCELKSSEETFYNKIEDGFATSVITILGTSFDETDCQLKRAREEICKYIIDTCFIIEE
jgi:hypothetical protein